MNLQKEEIDKLAKLASNGDTDSLARLCEYYYPIILKFIYYRVHPDCAEDLTSIVFCKIVKGISHLKGNFNAWIYMIARNVVIDHYRYNGRRSYVEFEDGKTVELEPAKYGSITMFNMSMDLQNILSALNETERDLLVLRFIQGCSSDEVAQIMGLTAGNVRTMQTRLLTRLRNEYRKEV